MSSCKSVCNSLSLSLWSQDVCQDANLRVSLTKVLKPDHLVVVIFLTNQKQNEQSEVTLAIEPPSNMKVYKQQIPSKNIDSIPPKKWI